MKKHGDAKTETEKAGINEQINTIVLRNSIASKLDKDKLINDFENELPEGKEIVDSDDLIYIIYPNYSFEVDVGTGDVTIADIEFVEDSTPWELAGKGTETEPYLIESIEDLVAFSNSVNSGYSYSGKYIKLVNTLDFNLPFSYDNYKTKVSEKTNRIIEEDSNGTELKTFLTSGTGFNPIGRSGYAFRGYFDGNGKEIKNIYINRPDEDYVALFGGASGMNNGSTIENLGISGSIIGYHSTAGIVATESQEGVIVKNCYNCANIKGDANVGGILGVNCGKILNCYNVGKIEGRSNVGGICGYQNNYEIYNCYNLGEIIQTSNRCGGIIGFNSGGRVYRCYNIGKIEGNTDIGGIIGDNSATTCSLQHSYNRGQVISENNWRLGGIAGSGETSECYYLKGTAEGGINGKDIEGQAMPLEESEMPSVISVLMTDNEQVEWNGEMVDVWKEDTENINNGYPILFWQ